MVNRYHWYRGYNRSNRCDRMVVKNAVYWFDRDNWLRVYRMHWMHWMHRYYRHNRHHRHNRDQRN